jgi:GNAT superfamily N-acetyltransferase
MTTEIARIVSEAYRWQRRLGNTVIAAPHCHIVADPAHPDIWDCNHADLVTAETDAAIDAVLAAMDLHLHHTPWRVVHTDGFAPDAFLARLALEDFAERPVTIQMVLRGELTARGPEGELRSVTSDADWTALQELIRADHIEGRRTAALDLSPEFTGKVVTAFRAKGSAYHFHLAIKDGQPAAYGAFAKAPNGAGIIEDLFTLPSARRQGIATAMIAAFCDRLRAAGSHTIFLGALATEPPKRLYRRLGFHPVGLARSWVKDVRTIGAPSQSVFERSGHRFA